MNSPKSILARKKLLIQIIVSSVISIIIQLFIYPVIINLLLRFQGSIQPQNQVFITSLSCWFFSFSVSYLIYPDNEIMNSYLFCSLIPLSVIVTREFLQGFYFDLLHIPPIIVVVYIIVKKRETINIKYVACTSPILVIWYLTVRILGLNYPYYELSLLGYFYMILWPILNISFAYILNYISKD